MSKSRREASLLWILPPFTLYCLAMGAVHVPKLNVILNLICYQDGLADGTPQDVVYSTDNAVCQNAQVESHLATFMLTTQLVSGVLCALTGPRLVKLSDRYGRNKILAFTALGMLLGDVITLAAATFPDHVSVNWIILEYALGGLVGAFIATMLVAESYVADCTSAASRSSAFGYVHGCMYAGNAIGPVVGGAIIRAASSNMLVIFYIASACHLLFIVSVLFIVPESLSVDRRQAAHRTYQEKMTSSSRRWSLADLLFMFEPLRILRSSKSMSESDFRTKSGCIGGNNNLLILCACDMVVFGVTLGSANIIIMYAEYTLKWSNLESSLFLSVANSCRVAVLVVVLPALSWLYKRQYDDKIRPSEGSTMPSRSEIFDLNAIRFTILFDVVGYLGYAVATSSTALFASGMIASIGSAASPTLQSAMTRHVDPGRTGELLGAVSLLHALARIVAPALLSGIYRLTVGRAASTVFWCLGIIVSCAAVASWWIALDDKTGGEDGHQYAPVELVESDES